MIRPLPRWAAANVQTGDVRYERVQFVSSHQAGKIRATIRTNQEIIADRDDVTNVANGPENSRIFTFADGTSWTVARAGRPPCGCG